MFNLNSLVQKAQSFIDPALSSSGDKNPSKSNLFRHQFRLPDSENSLAEIAAELSIPLPYKSKSTASPFGSEKSQGNIYAGRLHLSENFLCFSTQVTSFLAGVSFQASNAFNGQTYGAGPAGNGFILPLCSIRKVERLPTQNAVFALALTTWTGSTHTPPGQHARSDTQRFTLQFLASRQQCDRFCDGLKKGLRNGVKQVESFKAVVNECYSEYLLSGLAAKAQDGANGSGEARDPPDAGLGMLYKYPGDSKKLRDGPKMRLWGEYLRDNGRNATLLRQPTFHKLIRVGLPNRLRGEVWELASGSLWLRLQDPHQYTKTLSKYSGQQSLAIEEIEKDLNRSLPEYRGFQGEEGIGRLRRVLTAYSWTNTEVGYCQAMNIVVAALLIYMSESQAFCLLSVMCDRLLPGYYSKTMYGTLLDQKVLEALVEKTMPILWEHLAQADVQLSIVSLPWFLSLYINSMPLVFAFRVLDLFFLEGPKVLFQIGLAILRINGEELLDVSDDGSFILVLKNYFASLDQSAHPSSENKKLRAVTKFQELMVVALKEFSGITQATISEQRAKHKEGVLDSIETFAKRTEIRNLGPDSKRLHADDLGYIYDRFYSVLYEQQRAMEQYREDSNRRARSGSRISETESIEKGRVALGKSSELLTYDGFREFLASMTRWAVSDSPRSGQVDNPESTWLQRRNESMKAKKVEPADHDFMQRLFGKWIKDGADGLSMQDFVTGLADIKGSRDLMGTIGYFFDLYDDDKDGRVNREGILRISEALLFLSRRGLEGEFTLIGSSPHGFDESIRDDAAHDSITVHGSILSEKFLSSVSAFIRRCFEYADPDHPQNRDGADAEGAAAGLAKFSIGGDDDGQEDLLDMSDPKDEAKKPEDTDAAETTEGAASRTAVDTRQSANAALDPANPLHITLPTFRMVILADELLQQFFEFSFAESFHIAPASEARGPSTFSINTPSLTTFSSLASRPILQSPTGTSGSAAGSGGAALIALGEQAGAQAKGLRGLLDNIVSDGMRVAGEVRKRMDDAQKDLERSALGHDEEDEDEEDEDSRTAGLYGGKGAREADHDLLEGGDIGSVRDHEGVVERKESMALAHADEGEDLLAD